MSSFLGPDSVAWSSPPACRNRSAAISDVTLIDKSDAFVLGYSKLDLMFGHTTLAGKDLDAAGAHSNLQGLKIRAYGREKQRI
jgi:hypothetical protein